MAKKKIETEEDVKVEKVENIIKNEEKKKSLNGMAYTLLALLTAIVIMLVVAAGAAYIVINKNVNGVAEKNRSTLQGIPVVRWMLPKVADPEDPKYLTDDQIRSKYADLKKSKDDLALKLDEANKKIEELQKSKDNESKLSLDLEASKKNSAQLQNQIDTLKKEIESNKQKADAAQTQKLSEEAKKFSQLYEGMDPSASAKIFEQMGETKMDLIIEIIKNIKKETTSEILAAMNPSFASKLTEKMSKQYLPATK